MLKRGRWYLAGVVFGLVCLCGIAACNRYPVPQPLPKDVKASASFTILASDGGLSYAKQAQSNNIYYNEMSKLFSDSIGQPTVIRYDFLPAVDYTQQVIVRFASNSVPNILSSTSIIAPSNPTAVENGKFLPLDRLIDEYGPNLKAKIPEYVWQSPNISKNGIIYGIPKMITPINTDALFVRQDWLNRLHMKPPETLQDFLDFFQAVKNTDLNGNGVHDEIGYPMREGGGFSNAFFHAFGLSPGVWHEADGAFIPDIINPKMIEAIRFYKTLYDNGYINRDFLTTKASDWSKLIHSGRAAVWSHDIRNFRSWAPDTFAETGVKIRLLPGFKNEDGRYLLGEKDLGVARVYMIMAGTPHPERFVQFMNWAYSDDPRKNLFFDFGIEGSTYTEHAGVVDWNPLSKINLTQSAFYQTMINPAYDARMDEEVLNRQKQLDLAALKLGLRYEETNLYDNPSLNMPIPEAIKKNAILSFGPDSLFQEMLAKAITGQEDVEKAFQEFVAEWKQRGGNDALREANAWYASHS